MPEVEEGGEMECHIQGARVLTPDQVHFPATMVAGSLVHAERVLN